MPYDISQSATWDDSRLDLRHQRTLAYLTHHQLSERQWNRILTAVTSSPFSFDHREPFPLLNDLVIGAETDLWEYELQDGTTFRDVATQLALVRMVLKSNMAQV
jgi:hypothetical protein